MGMLYSFINGGSERLGALIASHLVAAGSRAEVCATHAADGPVRDRLRHEGVATFGMDVDRLGRFGRRWAIYRLLRRRRIEVLHVQHFSIFVLCYWPARLAGVRRIVVTEHNEDLLRADRRLRRRSRFYGARADLVTVIHEGLRDYLVGELGLPPSRVRTIPNGVDTRRFAPTPHDPEVRQEFGAQSHDLLLGTVGRLHPFKDQATLLRALARLRREAPAVAAVRLVLVGDGEERAALERLCQELGLADVVRFTGDRDDIERIMPQLDVFVLPSLTEGVPLVLLEAMACGVPCVATRVGGVPELFAAGGGRLVEPGDPDTLARALAALADDPAARRQLGTQARKLATERHDLSDMLAAYGRAIAGGEPQSSARVAAAGMGN